MSDKQTVYDVAPTRGHIDGRLIAVALILATLALGAGFVRLAGSMEPPAIDPTALALP